jgi:hypothetical protein
VKKRPTRTEETLAQLEAIRRDAAQDGIAGVRAALGDERAFVVGRAAEVAAELGFDVTTELPAAFARVVAAEHDTVPRTAVATVLLALALLRREDATAYLLETVERATPAVAVMAIGALALHSHDDAIEARVRSLVEARAQPELRQALAAKFGR